MRSDREFSVEKPPDTVRVVGIGDSGMFGWAVEQNEDPVTVLGQLLNARADGSRYEAINLAVPGYNTQMEVDSLVGKGLRYRPDIVVVGWCENDYRLPFMIPQGGQWTRGDVSFLWLLLFQRRHFSELALVQVKDARKAEADLVPSYFRKNSGLVGVRRSLARLRKLAAREGFRAIVFGPLAPRSVAICREVGIPYYNTLEKIPAGTWPKEWAVHFIHPRAEGYRLLARHLVAEFERLGWIRPGGKPL
jgi:lysophospholipase L1-like esterase